MVINPSLSNYTLLLIPALTNEGITSRNVGIPSKHFERSSFSGSIHTEKTKALKEKDSVNIPTDSCFEISDNIPYIDHGDSPLYIIEVGYHTQK